MYITTKIRFAHHLFSKPALAILFFNCLIANAQQTFHPLYNQSANNLEQRLNQKNILFHTSCKPYLESVIPEALNPDSCFSWMKKRNCSKKIIPFLCNHLIHENLILVSKDDLYLEINPLVDFELGKDFDWGRTTYLNGRGARIKGSIGTKFSFETNYIENQALLPLYLTKFVRDTNVIPGQGRAIKFKNDNSFDYGTGSGYISYTASKHFNFMLGQDKVFFGDGHRSLLLSDNCSSYPLVKITTSAWKFQYTNIWAQMLDRTEKSLLGEGYRKKFLAAHYLSMLIGKKIEWSLFEAVVWQAEDSNSYRGFDYTYLNPVIYYHFAQYQLGSPDNSIIGWNFKWKISNSISFYHQLVIDDLNLAKTKKGKGYFSNKYGFQLGLNYFNAFGLKGFTIQTEYNEVWPYTYAHKLPVQNYAHYNQPLAHPLGANFREGLLFLQFNHHRWFAGVELMYALSGTDSLSGDVGQNIYLSEFLIPNSTDANGKFIGTYGNYIGQGIATTLLFSEIKISYLINRHNNLMAEVSYIYREQKLGQKSTNTNFVTFGIKTSLFNHYYDF